jgi:phosphate:Na+ symporter
MSIFETLIAVIAAIAIFLYALEGFSRELQAVGGETLQNWLGKVTANRWAGFGVGALATAILQSSTAVSTLTTALVNASVISFRASLGMLLGANVGTTSTAWLVSFKLTAIGPMFIAAGALVALLPKRYGQFGRSLFYFGMIFAALDLISRAVMPLRELPAVMELMAQANSPLVGVLAGAFITLLVQSSTVTTGLAILLVQQGLLPPQAAIAITFGANAGTTSTALIASMGMSAVAKKTARYNFFFKTTGVIAFFPLIVPISNFLTQNISDTGQVVAMAHLMFNLTVSLIFMLMLNPIMNFAEKKPLPTVQP